jgi:hypothetical protein
MDDPKHIERDSQEEKTMENVQRAGNRRIQGYGEKSEKHGSEC